jgi:hypothetical protein
VIKIKNLAAPTVRIATDRVVIPPQQHAVRDHQRLIFETAMDPRKSRGVVKQLPARRIATRRAPCALGRWLAYMAALSLPALAMADTQAGSAASAWTYDASIYLYVPTIGGTTTFPAGGSSINVSVAKILEALNFTFMGAFDVHNGQWGVFNDLMYVNLGGSKVSSRDFTIGNIGLPAGTAANLNLDIKAWVWTLAAEYRVSDEPGLKLDLLGGTRYFDLAEKLNWTITGNLGPIDPGSRSGSAEASSPLWDAILGIKGRITLGAGSKWSVPFYLDGGAGDSNHTWQAAAGIAYSFQWGGIIGMWRYLDYSLSGNKVTGISFDGPLLGATFHW